MGCASSSEATLAAEINLDGEQRGQQVPKSNIKILQCQTRLYKSSSFHEPGLHEPVHFGAFSIAGTAEEVCPSHRAQGDALPKGGLPWVSDDELFWYEKPIKFADYLRSMAADAEVGKMQKLMACRDSDGARTKLSSYLDSNLAAYTAGGQGFPFGIFVSTLAEILATNGMYNTHEQTWPIACWNREYGDSIADVLSGKKHDFLQNLLDKPLFVHVGKKNDKIGAFSRYHKDGSGQWVHVGEFRPNAQWGVPSHDGLAIKDQYQPLDPEYQKRFWSTTGCEGVNGWRILAGADMFNEPGDKQGHCMMKMLMSAHKLYRHFAKAIESEPADAL